MIYILKLFFCIYHIRIFLKFQKVFCNIVLAIFRFKNFYAFYFGNIWIFNFCIYLKKSNKFQMKIKINLYNF